MENITLDHVTDFDHAGHNCAVYRYAEGNDFVAMSDAFPSLSWIEDTAEEAETGYRRLLDSVLRELSAGA